MDIREMSKRMQNKDDVERDFLIFYLFKIWYPNVRSEISLKPYIEPIEDEKTFTNMDAKTTSLQPVTAASTTKNTWMPNMTPDYYRLKPEVLKWNKGSWEEWVNFCDGSRGLNSAILKSPAGQIPIYIHNVTVDQLISGSIVEQGSWEGDIMSLIHHFMSRDPELQLIDIGAHIGEYSLMAAKMGRQVIAVDPLWANILRLCTSIDRNSFSPHIKVFYTALSDVRTEVSFVKEKGNLGGTKILVRRNRRQKHVIPQTRLDSNIKLVNTPMKFNKNVIDTVLLDDLLPFVSFKKAFMKIDVEEHENSVLKGGDQFFDSVDIKYVLMEWFQNAKNPRSAKEIIEFMKKHSYSAESPNTNHSPLVYSDFSKWPLTVLWVKH
ncbi:hypothetical protein LOTGIDRAFT_174922 [Lottia gigantea]|uniref:Methyltransferase FkbM domain-containing protein n=1 Tax=Lottia gigantea TaxID=225164 RepID=V4AH69_LOTGI|nr:hypothetical protein LOTGIDRAFT_174922 [Lottia gigantea]ESO96267.1 hypothetical protein LOTGIDRAFT_174922 [Lottia gigantea]